ncbi:MAG: hypothetical protein QNJ15_09775 [Erythrobacter sp.]|nr:hypothetical protein [Erythrobacter sp.]
MIDTAAGYLTQASKPETDDDVASQLVKDANQLGNSAYERLQDLEGSGADQIPHQVVGPFQRWVTGLGIENTIFFRADHVANYELRWYPRAIVSNLNSQSQSLLDAEGAIKWPFFRLTVPSRAMGMLPHFAIVGHELGHAIQDKNQLDLDQFNKENIESIERTEARLGTKLSQQVLVLRQGSLRSWVNEIWSDAVGYYLAGPAFFFALGAFFELSGGALGIGRWHPPSELRRRLVIDRLTAGESSFSNVFEKATGKPLTEDMNSPHLSKLPDADTLTKLLGTKLTREMAAICVELVPLIETLAGAIYSEAERVLTSSCPEMVYTPERLRADLEHFLDPLCHLIPPIESRTNHVTEPASLAGILNVGWAALIAKLDEIPASESAVGEDEAAAKMEKLQELLLKAVELSEAKQIWDET